jgi:pyridoxal phosphate enzyme (YggS family)
MIDQDNYLSLKKRIEDQHAVLCAVSKMQSIAKVATLYNMGQRVFGENYVQEFVQKQPHLPADIEWHFIGHLQSNKVKQIITIVHTIQSIDSISLLDEVNKQAAKHQKTVNCYLQVHIAQEPSKFGFSIEEALSFLQNYQPNKYNNVIITGIMGMATFTNQISVIEAEFGRLAALHHQIKATGKLPHSYCNISMGMSGDYDIALQQGSTLVRIGSLLFGERNY